MTSQYKQRITIILLGLLVPASPLLADSLKFNATLKPQFKMIDGSYREKLMNTALSLSYADDVDDWFMGARIATVGSSPRSLFVQPFVERRLPFQLHHLYTGWLQGHGDVSVGKLKPLFNEYSDFLWDKDIRPWGLRSTFDQVDISYTNIPRQDTGSFSQTLINISYYDDIKLDKKESLSGFVGQSIFNNIAGNTLHFTAGSNAKDSNGKIANNFNVTRAGLEWKNTQNALVEKLFIEGLKNLSAASQGKGFTIGYSIGNKKIKGWGQQKLSTMYRYLERDAWPDNLPDSAAYNGRTGIKGLQLIYNLGISSDYAIEIDLYRMDTILDLSKTYTYIQVKNKIKL